jgi:group I intron endonuclease
VTSIPHQPWGVVYFIHNLVNDGVYIGITRSYSIKKRWSNHRWRLVNNIHENPHLQRAWSKHGTDAFEFVVIEEHDTQEALDTAERFYIGYLRSIGARVYNQKDGGGFGGRLSAESRAKIGDRHRGKPKSAETRQRMSDASRGKKKPPMTEAHRTKIGNASRERQNDPAYREWRRETTGWRSITSDQIERRVETRIRNAGITYYLVAPDGTEYIVTNLTKFCQEHGLNKSSIKKLFNGPNRVRQYRGWLGRKEHLK